jgi:hypothetical protein
VSDPIVFNYPDLDTETLPHRTTFGGRQDLALTGTAWWCYNNAVPSSRGRAIRLIIAQGRRVRQQRDRRRGQRPAVYRDLVNGPTDQTVTVAYATADAYATAPGDYLPVSGTLTFTPGTTTQTVSVPVVGDTTPERLGFFYLRLSNAAGAVIRDGEGRGGILDSDPAIVITIDDLQSDTRNTQLRRASVGRCLEPIYVLYTVGWHGHRGRQGLSSSEPFFITRRSAARPAYHGQVRGWPPEPDSISKCV